MADVTGALELNITWTGPFTPEHVVAQFNDEGAPPTYDGEDYGLYQVYGRHILGDEDALLYVGRATDQTFAGRFRKHRDWLRYEWPVRVYLGRVYDPERHKTQQPSRWREDVCIAECALIYKYSPHYNSASVSEEPSLGCYETVRLIHGGDRSRLQEHDVFPADWR